MTTRIIDILRNTPLYVEMLEKVPEDQRAAAVAALEEQLRPYESLMASLPGSAIDNLMSSLSNKGSAASTDPQPTRRPPRRF
jgi:hypothetical protein